MAQNSRRESFGAYQFAVEIAGIKDAFFKSCSGLRSEAEVQEIVEGGVNNGTHKLVGRTKYPNIVLKQGFSGPPFTLWNLRQSFVDESKKFTRFAGSITQLGPNGSKAVWSFKGGWICKWEGPDFDAGKNEISIESIEIAHEGLYQLSGDIGIDSMVGAAGAGAAGAVGASGGGESRSWLGRQFDKAKDWAVHKAEDEVSSRAADLRGKATDRARTEVEHVSQQALERVPGGEHLASQGADLASNAISDNLTKPKV